MNFFTPPVHTGKKCEVVTGRQTNHPMTSIQKHRITVLALIASLLFSTPAFAWDAVGHKTVTRIAWDHLKPQTRSRVIALLNAAPADSEMRKLMPPESLPPDIRNREFFMAASNWADVMRDQMFPERQAKYNRPTWHYCDFFWEQSASGPQDRPDLRPDAENALERLQLIRWMLGDDARPDEARAIELAWLLHLAGDVHQPLHCSARVTENEPKGDQGGNLFKLEEKMPDKAFQYNLHAYWDGIVGRVMPKQMNENEIDYIGRVAQQIEAKHPRESLQSGFRPGEFSVWVMEGFITSKTKLYPASLRPLEMPSQQYQDAAWQIAEPALALAGYRLAQTLDQLFSTIALL